MFQTAKNFVKASRLSRDASHSRKRILVLSLSCVIVLFHPLNFVLGLNHCPIAWSTYADPGATKLRRHGMLEIYHVWQHARCAGLATNAGGRRYCYIVARSPRACHVHSPLANMFLLLYLNLRWLIEGMFLAACILHKSRQPILG